jgi:uncharacterized SAM-binding protein YcdF (DUF218 family)
MPTDALLRHRKLRLVQRRTLWCLTWFGAFCGALFLAAPAVWWFYCGESFLSLTERRPAEILVVEGWIGRDGVRAAATEFERGAYQYVVTSGGVSKSEGWAEGGWSYAEGARQELIRSGVPETKIIVAPAIDVDRQRTYESALAVWRKLQSLSIKPTSINVFTRGPHARRSRLVFAKVEGSGTKVGVISWSPSRNQAEPWWRGSNRAKDLLIETVGYLFEALFNSGRGPTVTLARGEISGGTSSLPTLGEVRHDLFVGNYRISSLKLNHCPDRSLTPILARSPVYREQTVCSKAQITRLRFLLSLKFS